MPNDALAVILILLLVFLLLGVPVLLGVLWVMVSNLKQRLEKLEGSAPKVVPVSNTTMPATPVLAPVASVVVPELPKLPPQQLTTQPVATSREPDPVVKTLREYGLLPPSDLKGEFALGSWWTVRVGGALALAAAVFLGIWLNLHSVLPAWVRLSELVVLGTVLLGVGLKLQSKREDLGRVIGAAGLGVFVFAAWAAYGLEKMRVLNSALEAGRVQFYVSVLIAGFALYRRDRLYAQLAIIFSTLAIFFSVAPHADALALSLSAATIALLGAIFYARGGWSSTGVLGLVGSQVAFLAIWEHLADHAQHRVDVQIGAALALAVLWCGERFVIAEGGFRKEATRVSYFLSLVLAPCLVGLLVAIGAEHERFTAALVVAGITAVLGLVEVRCSLVSAEILWGAALVFLATAGAWRVEQKMVWLVWVLASAVAQLTAIRSGSKILRWVADGLAMVAVASYLNDTPDQPWLRLLALGLLAILVVMREWRGVSSNVALKVLAGLGVMAVVVYTQDDFPVVDTGWPWLVVVVVGLIARCPTLLWAVVPAYLISHYAIIEPSFSFKCFLPKISNQLPAENQQAGLLSVWSWVLAVLDGVVVLKLVALVPSVAATSRFSWSKLMAGVAAALTLLMLISGVYFGFGYYTLKVSEALSQSCYVILWVLGAVGLTLVHRFLESQGVSSAVRFPLIVGFIAGMLIFQYGVTSGVTLKEVLFWLAGLAILLVNLHQLTDGLPGSHWYRGIGASTLMLLTLAALSRLPGAGVSLFWALAAAILFMLGFKLQRRSFRMVSLVFLALATLRVLTKDVTDMLGRVIACGAVAIIFLVVAWLYGKFAKQARA